jgi:dihydropteroate synthase
MEYHEAANYLFDLRRYAPRAGLAETRDLLAFLGDPQESYAAVQIAGSNGKGSTARMLERTLREAGLDVGLYTSPHLDDLRERVRVNGRTAPRSALAAFVAEARDYLDDRAAAGASPTFFETVTAFALREFARQDVDVAVLEVGIGGRHDATSVVDPVASAVTSVTLEHQAMLGDTVGEIAADKAHVAPADRPLVTATTGEALEGVRSVAPSVARVVRDSDGGPAGPEPAVTVDYGGRAGLEGRVSLSGEGWAVDTRLPLLGDHQADNAGVAAALARQVADALGVAVTEAHIARGLRNAHWPGRFEVMGREPLVVLDGAHNPGGCAGLAATLSGFEYDDLHLVFGVMCDKDHDEMVARLPAVDHAYPCRSASDRAERVDALAALFAADTGAAVHPTGAVPAALDAALDRAGADDCVLVAGSLYTVAEARRRWTRVEVPKSIPDRATAAATLADANVSDADVERARDDAVHRVVKTTVQPRQATVLRREMLALGGQCAVSALSEQDRELVDVVLMGTLAQHRRLHDRLSGERAGLDRLATELGRTLDDDATAATSDYPYPWSGDRTAVMGVLNVTPDSFHDGGRYEAIEDAVARAEEMVAAGVDIVDVGGESTRPGAEPVPPAEERDRVVPVIERVSDLDVTVSIDTRKASVARAALDAGADLLNDVSGLADPEMRLVAADYDVPVVVMHSVNVPVDPEVDEEYDDVVEDVLDELTERVLLAEKAGLDRSQILVDPGLGFGKSRTENFELLGRIGEFRALDCPVLVGHSHKSMFGLLGYEDGERLPATVAATAVAAANGADVVRVHDVTENVAATRVVAAAARPDEI